MQCHHFDAGRCRSCTLLPLSYEEQLARKEDRVRAVLAGWDGDDGPRWLPPFRSPESGFRNKAKMVVSGSAARPVIGILDEGGRGVDLRDCPLYPASLQAAFAPLADLVTQAGLEPYDVPGRTGELKYLLVTQAPSGELMVRFVLRSAEALPALREHLPALRDALPRLLVASANIQPEHTAIIEGEREVLLSAAATLPMQVNDVLLHLRPQSFFQTNTAVAAGLYRQAREWVGPAAVPAAPAATPRPAAVRVWDLYCGVGGFALHVAGPGREVIGVERSVEAVASAERSRREAGYERVGFLADDATAFALEAAFPPAMVLVNPPRRGIGPELAAWLEGSGVERVLYSSCNPASLARDVAAMPSLRPRVARLFDMFPFSPHAEVLTLLERG